jgi:hypothetical protein
LQEKFEWIEEPLDQKVKAGKCEEATFTCKLSHKGKKAKWYVRNQVRNGCSYYLVGYTKSSEGSSD